MASTLSAVRTGKRSLLDPRTKILLVIMVIAIMMSGGRILIAFMRWALTAVPFILLLSERKFRTAFIFRRSEFPACCAGYRSAVHAGYRDGFLYGRNDDCQRVHGGDGTHAHSAENNDPHVGNVPFFPHSRRGIWQYHRRYANARNTLRRRKAGENAGISHGTAYDILCEDRRRAFRGGAHPGIWRSSEAHEYL